MCCVRPSFVVTFYGQFLLVQPTAKLMADYRLVLSSTYDECRRLQDFLEVMAEREGFSSGFLQELHLVVKEAFVNAVRHGNRGNREKNVCLSLESFSSDLSRELLIDISDCGSGFAIHDVDDPRDPDHVMKSSGRGIFLIRSYAEILDQQSDENGCSLRLRMRPY